jgi:hypothetical protein
MRRVEMAGGMSSGTSSDSRKLRPEKLIPHAGCIRSPRIFHSRAKPRLSRNLRVLDFCAMSLSQLFPPCECCHSLAEFATNHCPRCHSLKTFNLSKITDQDLISFCESCGTTFDLRVVVSKYL